jgi:hypothetical protein
MAAMMRHLDLDPKGAEDRSRSRSANGRISIDKDGEQFALGSDDEDK